MDWEGPKAPEKNWIPETSIVFTDKAHYFGTQDFIKRIPGYDPRHENHADSGIMHMGDMSKQSLFIKRQLIDLTGFESLHGGLDPEAEIKQLYENAMLVAQDLKLRPGITLTKEHVASIQEDIIWPEHIHIDGQDVLVPRVYLAKSKPVERFNGMRTLGTIDIEGESVNIGHKMVANSIQGGRVYDMDNLYIVTPRYHKEVLDKVYHRGIKK